MLQHGKVVRRHEDRQVEFFPDLVKHVHEKAHALDVHTGKRLVENENIRHGLKRQCQQNALQFAARERADALVDERFTVDVRKAGQNFFPHGPCRAQKRGALENAAGKKIHHAHGVTAVKGRALRHIADAQLCLLAGGLMEGDFSLIFPLAQNGTDKRRLARAVRADQRDHLAAVHMQVDIVQDRLAADMDGQMLDFQAAGMFAVARVRVQMWNHESASRMMSML